MDLPPIVGVKKNAHRRGREFRRALNHSKFVVFFKFALPILGFVLLAVLAVLTIFREENLPNFSKNSVTVENGRITILNPKLNGLTKDNRPYTLKAQNAFQNVTDNHKIEMQKIDAEVPFQRDKFVTLTADSGVYDHDLRVLNLYENIIVTTNDGMKANFSNVVVDLAKNEMQTRNPLFIKNTNSSITAQSMFVDEGGKHMIFKGNVRVIFNPSSAKRTGLE
jgi:lipopolysaccharide export system protein LptC